MRKQRHGHTLLETTLVLLPLLAILLAGIDLTLALFAREALQAAVGEAARMAAAPPARYEGVDCGDPEPCAARLVERRTLGLVPAASVRLERHADGRVVEVRAEDVVWRWAVPLPGLWPGQGAVLTASALNVVRRLPEDRREARR